MGFNLPGPTQGGDAPDVADGLAIIRFDDIKERFVEAFVTESDNYGKPDDGHRLDFVFTLGEDSPKGPQAVYGEDGDPIELRQAKSIKPGSTGTKSNYYALISNILTPKELAAWEASTPEDPFDGSAVQGRWLHGKIAHNKRGWPEVTDVVAIYKPAAKKTKAELQAEAAALLAAAEAGDD